MGRRREVCDVGILPLDVAIDNAQDALEAATGPFSDRLAAMSTSLIHLLAHARAVGPSQVARHVMSQQVCALTEMFVDESLRALDIETNEA